MAGGVDRGDQKEENNPRIHAVVVCDSGWRRCTNVHICVSMFHLHTWFTVARLVRQLRPWYKDAVNQFSRAVEENLAEEHRHTDGNSVLGMHFPPHLHVQMYSHGKKKPKTILISAHYKHQYLRASGPRFSWPVCVLCGGAFALSI